MGVLIDSSVLIASERGLVDLESHLTGRGDEEFFISVVSVSELLHGVHRATEPGIRARRSAWVEAIVERFPLLAVDVPIARAHARLWAELAARGQLIGPHDLWLAATCIAYGLAMVTANEREFRRVAGLQVEHWEAAE